MATKDIVIPGTTPAAAAEALKKTGYNVKIQAENSDTESEMKEGDTMLDMFPELNQDKPAEGEEIKDVKATKPKQEKVKLENPKLPKSVKKETKITNKTNVMERLKGNLITKKEVLETIQGNGGAQPATKPGTSPTITPTKTPARPAQRPDRKNPFQPKHNPKPKGEKLPEWLSSDALGFQQDNLNEITEELKRITKKGK